MEVKEESVRSTELALAMTSHTRNPPSMRADRKGILIYVDPEVVRPSLASCVSLAGISRSESLGRRAQTS